MAQFIVRNLDDAVKARLKRQAERHGRTMEDEVRHILRDAAMGECLPARRLGSCIAARFRKLGLTEDLLRLCGQPVRPAKFDK